MNFSKIIERNKCDQILCSRLIHFTVHDTHHTVWRELVKIQLNELKWQNCGRSQAAGEEWKQYCDLAPEYNVCQSGK